MMKPAIRTIGLAALTASLAYGLFAVAGCSSSKDGGKGTVTLRYANFPPSATFPCVQMERWKSEIEKRTNGKVKVDTFPGGTLLGAKNMFDGIESGGADIGCAAMSYQPGRFPVSEAIDLPVGFTSAKVATQTLNDLMDKYQPKEFDKFKVIAYFTCAPSQLMTVKPIQSLEDLQREKPVLRAAGTAVEVVKPLGANVVGMAMSEVPDAVQKSVVKGVVSSLEVLQDMNFAAYCPYATHADLPVVTFAVVMNKKVWDSLDPEVQKAIDDMRQEHTLWTAEYEDKHVTDALAWAKEKSNHQLFQLSPADQAKVMELGKPVIDSYVKRVSAAGLPGEQIVKDVYSFKEAREKQNP